MASQEEMKAWMANWQENIKKTAEDPVLEKRFLDLYGKWARKIAGVMGITEIPKVEIRIIKDCPYPALTPGTTVCISQEWFSDKKDDGALIHEFVHAIMAAPIYDKTNSWLIEGIADYIRDKLGFQDSWTYAHYKNSRALDGYQNTAHFLMYLEQARPTIVRELSQLLIDGTYSEEIFGRFFGKSLSELVEQYGDDYS